MKTLMKLFDLIGYIIETLIKAVLVIGVIFAPGDDDFFDF